eukprot:6193288-Pleurochrysis_carterae.AAC.1
MEERVRHERNSTRGEGFVAVHSNKALLQTVHRSLQLLGLNHFAPGPQMYAANFPQEVEVCGRLGRERGPRAWAHGGEYESEQALTKQACLNENGFGCQGPLAPWGDAKQAGERHPVAVPGRLVLANGAGIVT